MKFSLDSKTFNSLLKRLVALTSSDKDSNILFLLDNNKLQVFYTTRIDKVDTQTFFHENVNVTESTGNGLHAVRSSNLLSIKIPEYSSDEKFPHCKSINFTFTQSLLNITYSIAWNRGVKENSTKLHFPVLAPTEYSLDDVVKPFEMSSKEVFNASPLALSEAIGLVNFIKSDATSKEANGCLLATTDTSFLLVNTDSNSAIKYEFSIEPLSQERLSVVLAPNVLNFIKLFLPEEGTVTVSKSRSALYIKTEERRMVVPIMQSSYIIDDPAEFFENTSKHLAVLELKPFISVALALVSKTADRYKKLSLNFQDGGLDLACGADKTENLPSKVLNKGEIHVNGSLLVSCCQKILNLELDSNVFYDEPTNRITLATQDGKMTCLVQGLSL